MHTSLHAPAPAALLGHRRTQPSRRKRKTEHSRARSASSAPQSAASASSPDQDRPPKAEAATPAKPAFVNKQHFKVPEDAADAFEAAWSARAEHMETMPGFQGFDMRKQGSDSYLVESRWQSIPDWEAFSLSKPARRHHLPTGIWQYVPKPGDGFPEDFVPFVDMNTFVQAKYPPKKKTKE